MLKFLDFYNCRNRYLSAKSKDKASEASNKRALEMKAYQAESKGLGPVEALPPSNVELG